jgi:hypothetical protein
VNLKAGGLAARVASTVIVAVFYCSFVLWYSGHKLSLLLVVGGLAVGAAFTWSLAKARKRI